MSQQDEVNALTARLKALEPKVAQIEANQSAPVDLTAVTAEVTTLEAAVNAGLPTP